MGYLGIGLIGLLVLVVIMVIGIYNNLVGLRQNVRQGTAEVPENSRSL